MIRCCPVLLVALLWAWSPAARAEEKTAADAHGAPAAAAPHAAEKEPADAHGHDHGAAEHAGAHHDEFDLSHANASQSLESPAEFKSDLAIYTFVVFVLLLLILTKFAWKPISEGLDRREKAIADEIEAAKRNSSEARQMLAEYKTKLDSAAAEVRELLDQARRDAEHQKQSILTEAQQAAQSEKDRAVKEIVAAKSQALRELAEKSVDTAVDLAGRIVRRQLTTEDHARLVQDSLDKFSNGN